MRLIILFILCIIINIHFVNAQDYPIDKKASIVSGSFLYTSQGDSSKDNHKLTTIDFSLALNYFIFRHFFAGGTVVYSSYNYEEAVSDEISIGPQAGVAFGNIKNNAYPFISAGYRYQTLMNRYIANAEKLAGSDVIFGAGLIIPVRQHLGVSIEANYQILFYNKSSYNTFSVGIGILGLFYKTPRS